MPKSQIINVIARTLGGSEYNVSVDNRLTIAELKEVIAVQANGFSSQTMRLLKGMNALEDHQTLVEVSTQNLTEVETEFNRKGLQRPA